MPSESGPRPESALELLYRKYDRLVRWVLRAAGVPESALDDLAHDVFLTIHRRLGDRDTRVPLRQWVAGVARNVAFSQRRARARELQRVQELAPLAAPPRPDEILAAHEAWRALSGFLARLSPKQREVFVMVEVTGMRISELSATTGISADTLHSRLRTARAHFGRHFPGDAAAQLTTLRRAQAGARPSPEQRRRTWALVVASVGGATQLAPRAVLVTTTTTIGSGWTSLWAWPSKAVGVFALVGSLGAVAAMTEPADAVRPPPKPPVAVPLADGPVRMVPPTAVALNDRVELDVAPSAGTAPAPMAPPATPTTATSQRSPRAKRTPPKVANDTDAAMLAAMQVIARARRELAAERPEAALATLDTDSARYAPLDRERQRLTLEAACALGRTSRAQNAREALGEQGSACPEKTQSP